MKITVHRQACCSQDDQCGSLEAEYSIEADTTFSSLIHEIVKSGFLQFSSTHDQISGEVDGKWLVEVFSPYGPNARQPEFNASANMRTVELPSGKTLSFRFRHV